jgi:catechol 2,3-dioxygenase-like lactoylglutathione lyase family enzyme
MLDSTKAFSGFGVGDIARAKQFYGETLGLPVTDVELGKAGAKVPGGLHIDVGAGFVLVYPRPNHIPAPFTILNFVVPNLEAAVDELAAKGVSFEHYAGELQTDARGIHRDPTTSPIAWFTDPDGNVLSLIEE